MIDIFPRGTQETIVYNSKWDVINLNKMKTYYNVITLFSFIYVNITYSVTRCEAKYFSTNIK